MQVVFYMAGALALIAGGGVVLSRSAVHGALWMIASLLCVAAVMASLGALFVAALEVIVYAGAIMVLFVFALLLLGGDGLVAGEEALWRTTRPWRGPSLVCGSLLACLVTAPWIERGLSRAAVASNVPAGDVAVILFGDFMVAVELVSLLLLSGIVAVVHLSRVEPGRRS